MTRRSPFRNVTYRLTQFFVRAIGTLVFGLRVFGAEHWPTEGGSLVCSNHQSYFDPVIVGSCCNRRLNYLARESLFQFFLFGWLIKWFDAIPLQREGIGIGGLKETMKRLKRGESVLIFPEGTRTLDGELQPPQPGFCVLARRCRVPIIPVALDGAYQAWPKGRRYPRVSQVQVAVGPAITVEEVVQLTDDELVAEVSRRLAKCLATVRTYQAGL